MVSLFAASLMLSLLLALTLIFVGPVLRRRLRWALLATLAGAWLTLALSLLQIGARTRQVLPVDAARQQLRTVESEAGTVLLSLGAPALLVTLLCLLALRVGRSARSASEPPPRHGGAGHVG